MVSLDIGKTTLCVAGLGWPFTLLRLRSARGLRFSVWPDAGGSSTLGLPTFLLELLFLVGLGRLILRAIGRIVLPLAPFWLGVLFGGRLIFVGHYDVGVAAVAVGLLLNGVWRCWLSDKVY